MANQFKKYIEQPTASISITTNNTYDVTEKAEVVVNVPNPSTGKIEITTTAEIDVTNYATAQVVDSDLVAANIKSGVDILGVTGTASTIDTVSSVPSTKSTEIIYNSTNTSYYLWDEPSLCFTANTAGSTVSMSVTGTPTLGQNFSYSTDNGTNWNTFTPGTTTVTLTNAGDKVYFKGNNPNGVNEYDAALQPTFKFVMIGSISASGNIMSLIDDGACTTTTIPNIDCFIGLFMECTSLTSPPALPATTLTNWCYALLFYGCTSLASAPVLAATSIAKYCYYYMFGECSSLATAPELPATTLTDGCYSWMFGQCASLTSAPALPATTLATECYTSMFEDCGSLTTVPNLPATAGLNNYQQMFQNCTSLQVNDSAVSGTAEQAWTLPSSGTVTTLESAAEMFTGCAGTRASNTLDVDAGSSKTYYTQNTPV